MAIGAQYPQQFRKDSTAKQKILAPPLIGASQVIEPGCFANLLADLDRRAVLQNVRKPRRIGLVARRTMHRAPVMDDHGARRNWPHRRRFRIETGITLDRIGFLGTSVQAMGKQAQLMRTRNVCHGTIFYGAIGHCDPNADFIIFKARLAKRFILVPRSRTAFMNWLENRVISGKSGLRTQQLPSDC